METAPQPGFGTTPARAQRIREFQRWSGAKLVDASGQVIEDDPDVVAAMDLQMAQQELDVIRMALKSGCVRVHCCTGNHEVMRLICSDLSAAERAKVTFDFFETPEPDRVVRVQD